MPARSDQEGQIPLGLRHPAAYGRDDLVMSDSIAAALRLVDSWPHWPSPLAGLVGPASSGKSHLAAIWKQRAVARIVAVADLPGLDIEAAATRPVLIEDIGENPFDEIALFHLLNALREQRGTLLFTSRRAPGHWQTGLADLRSRLRAATVAQIFAPDDEMLRRIIVKLFSDRQLAVERPVVDFMVARMERSFEAARLLVDAIDNAALVRKMRITRRLAGEVLAAMEQREGRGSG